MMPVGFTPTAETILPSDSSVLRGSMFMSAMGILGAIWADKFDHMSAVTNFIITPLTFLSGTFYTIDRLPPMAQAIAHYNPFFYAIDGFRYGFSGLAVTPILWSAVILLMVTFALVGICLNLLRRGIGLKS